MMRVFFPIEISITKTPMSPVALDKLIGILIYGFIIYMAWGWVQLYKVTMGKKLKSVKFLAQFFA